MLPPPPPSALTQIGYSPHVYTGSFTLWKPPSYGFAYETATREARGRRGVLLVTEFGGGFNADAQNLAPTLDGQVRWVCADISSLALCSPWAALVGCQWAFTVRFGALNTHAIAYTCAHTSRLRRSYPDLAPHSYLGLSTHTQDEYLVTGATMWSWKSNCYNAPPSNGCNESAWTIFDPAPGPAAGPIGPNGNLRPERERLLSRVHSRGTVGAAAAYLFNTTDQTFYLHVTASAAAAPGQLEEAREVAPQAPKATSELVALLDEAARYASGPEDSAAAPSVLRVVPAGTPARLISEIERAAAANGSLTQIYIPRGVSWNISVTGAAALSQVRECFLLKGPQAISAHPSIPSAPTPSWTYTPLSLQVIRWPDGSRTALVLPSQPPPRLQAYTVAVGPPGWLPPPVPPSTHASTLSWDTSAVLANARAKLQASGALKHGTEWCSAPPQDWTAVQSRIDAIVASDPLGALPRLLRAAERQEPLDDPASERVALAGGEEARVASAAIDALVTLATAVAQLRDAMCGYA
jgi:hypothetical protein